MTKKTSREIILTVPMIPDMELAVTKTLDGLSKFISLSPDQFDEVRHAIIEACVNASEHSRSKDRKIYLKFCIEPAMLKIDVADYGSGFDPNSVEEPDIRNKLFKSARKRGWGLKLMQHFMDEVVIQSSSLGTEIKMIKYARDKKEAVNE